MFIVLYFFGQPLKYKKQTPSIQKEKKLSIRYINYSLHTEENAMSLNSPFSINYDKKKKLENRIYNGT